jgi:alkylation response protein AidB-like acyl-CoA dehydrogenase
LHAALSKDGWIGIALPEDLGGSGLGISEATMMLHTISEYVLKATLFLIIVYHFTGAELVLLGLKVSMRESISNSQLFV